MDLAGRLAASDLDDGSMQLCPWSDDRVRCRAAGVPDEVGFATKVEMARSMLSWAFAAGIPAAWVTRLAFTANPAITGLGSARLFRGAGPFRL